MHILHLLSNEGLAAWKLKTHEVYLLMLIQRSHIYIYNWCSWTTWWVTCKQFIRVKLEKIMIHQNCISISCVFWCLYCFQHVKSIDQWHALLYNKFVVKKNTNHNPLLIIESIFWRASSIFHLLPHNIMNKNNFIWTWLTIDSKCDIIETIQLYVRLDLWIYKFCVGKCDSNVVQILRHGLS